MHPDMVKPKFANLARLAPALALLSCAAPKAVVVEEAPVKKPEVAPATTVPEPPVPTDDPYGGFRVPDMLDLPGDGEFRTTGPTMPKPGGEANAVIARPPMEPPSRPKPKEGE